MNGYDRPLILSGDLNVAHEDADLTHPAFFKVRVKKNRGENNASVCVLSCAGQYVLVGVCFCWSRVLKKAKSVGVCRMCRQGRGGGGAVWRTVYGNICVGPVFVESCTM